MFQLSSAASLNLERSQNGVLGNGLRDFDNVMTAIFYFSNQFMVFYPLPN